MSGVEHERVVTPVFADGRIVPKQMLSFAEGCNAVFVFLTLAGLFGKGFKIRRFDVNRQRRNASHAIRDFLDILNNWGILRHQGIDIAVDVELFGNSDNSQYR